jgi:hypothetical protein
VFFKLTLTLFKARIFLVDDVDAALPADNLTVRGAAFDGGANFHIFLLKMGDCDLWRQRQKCLRATRRKSERLSKNWKVASVLLKFFSGE